jgi:hypothetical protein
VVNGIEANGPGVTPSAVQEVKINNNPYSARFSRPGRARLEIVTKSGSPPLVLPVFIEREQEAGALALADRSCDWAFVVLAALGLAKARSRAGIREKSGVQWLGGKLPAFQVRNLIPDHVEQQVDVQHEFTQPFGIIFPGYLCPQIAKAADPNSGDI